MTKMATVQAQQMWEYMSITRKTEDFLVTELNEAGELGWEMVAAAYRKDTKSVAGTYCWTALLKRPLVPHGQPKPSESAIGAAPRAGFPAATPPSAQDAEESIFDVRPEPDEEEPTGDQS